MLLTEEMLEKTNLLDDFQDQDEFPRQVQTEAFDPLSGIDCTDVLLPNEEVKDEEDPI